MPPKRWKAIKSVLFGALATALVVFAILWDAEPTVALMMGGLLLLIFYGVEVHEVEIAKWVSIRFKNGHERPDVDDEEE